MDLRLRPLRLQDEAVYRVAHAELVAERFSFGFIKPEETFAGHVARLERQRRGLDLGDEIVGRVSIRHRLNEDLAFHGGHIGYAVRPWFRRRGYATEMLGQSLVIVRSYGVEQVLVTCDHDNVGSAAVIEACGGRLERVVPDDESDNGVAFRRYWIR